MKLSAKTRQKNTAAVRKETYTQPLLAKHRPLLNLTGKSFDKTSDKQTDKPPQE